MAENRFQPRQNGRVIPQAVTMFLNDSKEAFHGWENLTISKSLDQLSNAFSFQLPQSFQQRGSEFKLGPGVKVSVFVNNERVMTGRIDKTSISLSSDQKQVTVSGRSLNADLVDCTVEGAKEYRNIDFKTFVSQLISPFGIQAFYSVEPKLIDKIGVKPGDTVFEVLDKVARLQGFFWISTRAGNIRLTRAGRGRATTRIIEDVNFLSGSVELDDSQRFQTYTVLGQTVGTDNYPGVNAAKGKGTASDSQIKRYRPLTMIAEGNVDNDIAQTRAQWEATTRIARAIKVNIVVQGWQQQDNSLWGLNQLINISSPTLGIEGDFLSTSIAQTRTNDSGTLTTIGMTRQDAYDPQPDIGSSEKGLKTIEGIVAFSQRNASAND